MAWFRRPDGVKVVITNPDVIAKQVKEGFVPCEAPEVEEAREAAARERLKAELRAELEAEKPKAEPATAPTGKRA